MKAPSSSLLGIVQPSLLLKDGQAAELVSGGFLYISMFLVRPVVHRSFLLSPPPRPLALVLF
jgi:hypothetical protein